MLKIDDQRLDKVEAVYPGFREMVDQWEAMELLPCPRCGSADTAKVSAGLVGRSIHLAAATSKIRLLPNGHPADYYCNQCKSYFSQGDGEPKFKPGGSTIPGSEVVEAMKTPERARALWEQLCGSMGIAPGPIEPDDLKDKENSCDET